METQTELKTSIDGLDVVIEALPVTVSEDDFVPPEDSVVSDRLKEIESLLLSNRDRVDILNKEMGRIGVRYAEQNSAELNE